MVCPVGAKHDVNVLERQASEGPPKGTAGLRRDAFFCSQWGQRPTRSIPLRHLQAESHCLEIARREALRGLGEGAGF